MLNSEQLVFGGTMGDDINHVNVKGQHFITTKISHQFAEYQNSKIKN